MRDAIVVGVVGKVPGDVALSLECDYLRKGFSEPGSGFVLGLIDCTRLQFQPWSDDGSVVTDLIELEQLGLKPTPSGRVRVRRVLGGHDLLDAKGQRPVRRT